MNKLEEVKSEYIKTRIEMMQQIPQLPKDVICTTEDFYVESRYNEVGTRKFAVLDQGGFEIEEFYGLEQAFEEMERMQRYMHYRTEAEANMDD
tara:strand:- start:849 stop:1127 length:279 start_codon:yes stop_codon:yes gene_type:complete